MRIALIMETAEPEAGHPAGHRLATALTTQEHLVEVAENPDPQEAHELLREFLHMDRVVYPDPVELELDGMCTPSLAGPLLWSAFRNARERGTATVLMLDGKVIARLVPVNQVEEMI